MARDHARIQVAIWDDDDFIGLTAVQQQVYLALLSSSDLSYAGVCPLLPGRIAGRAADLTKAKVQAALRVLERTRFIVVDAETDEILVRSYVRHDGILKQPNMLAATIKAWALIHSEKIQQAILIELERGMQEGFPDGLTHGYTDALMKGFRKGLPEGFPATLWGKGSGEGFPPRVTPTPLPPSPFPLNPPLASLVGPPDDAPPDSPPAKPKRGTRIDPEFVPSEQSRATIIAEHPDLDLRREHTRFVDYWTAKAGQSATKLDWDATWRNWMRRAGDQLPRNGAATSRRQQETDDMFARSMARAQAIEEGRDNLVTMRGELE